MSDVYRTIEAVWKIESTRLIAAIARVTPDIGIAEELEQDALVAALERWPEEGIPENPAPWLMTAAKRRAIDSHRRLSVLMDCFLNAYQQTCNSATSCTIKGGQVPSGHLNRSGLSRMNVVRRFLAISLLVVAAVSGSVSIGLFVLSPAGSLVLFQPQWPVAAVLCWDAFLSFLFFLQHSGMVRRSFRARLKQFIPPWSYSAAYTIASSIVLAAVVVLWQPTGRHLVVLEGLPLRIVQAVSVVAVAFFFWGAIALKGFDPFGLTPIRTHLRGWEEPRPAFVANGPYRWVRHPLYFSILLLLWFSPGLTLDRLLFNILWTAWIWIATRWEERDLESDFGDAYRQYQKRVPMLIPWRAAS